MKRKWNKKIQGNRQLRNAFDPLRNYLNYDLPKVSLKNYSERPSQILNLSQGDPTTSIEFRTHTDNLKLLADCTGLIDGQTDCQGLLTSRIALADKYSTASHRLSCNDIYLTYGGGMALWMVMNLLGQEGDNFLFPSPGYPVSLGMANIIGMNPRFYELVQNRNWQANIEEMQKLIDKKTKFIIVIDPSNPLGSVWSAEHKREIIKLCIKKNVPLLADQIYESMSYEIQVTPFAQLVQPDEVQKITIFKCSGLTKMYLGPGWRMGWLVTYTSQKLKLSLNKYLRGMLSVYGMANTIVQKAIPGMICNLNNVIKIKDCIGRMHHNQKMLKKQLKDQKYCNFGHSSGAIFATIIMRLQHFQPEQIGKGIIDFTQYFYAEQNVIVYPGDLFTGKVPFIRMMISCSVQKIQEFLMRFKRFCKRHLKKQI